MKGAAIGWVGAVLACGALTEAYVKFVPSNKIATPQQLRGLVSSDLLVEIPKDPTAVARFVRFEELAGRVVRVLRNDTKTDTAEQRATQLAYDRAEYLCNRNLIDQADALLREGPITVPKTDPMHRPERNERNLIAAVKCASEVSGRSGNQAACQRYLLDALRISKAVSNASGSTMQAVTAFSVEDTTFKAILEAARSGWLSKDSLKTIAEALPNRSTDDPNLKSTLISEFQDEVLPLLSSTYLVNQVTDSPQNAGNFDSEETARLISSIFETELRNAKLDWPHQISGFDPFVTSKLASVNSISESYMYGGSTTDASYAIKMSLIPNSLGREYCQGFLQFMPNVRKDNIVNSTRLELLKGVIAYQRFKLDHAGKRPISMSQLIRTGYLRRAPIDWFSMKPVRFSPSKDQIYSLGTLMVDEGGFSKRTSKTPDGALEVPRPDGFMSESDPENAGSDANFGYFLEEPVKVAAKQPFRAQSRTELHKGSAVLLPNNSLGTAISPNTSVLGGPGPNAVRSLSSKLPLTPSKSLEKATTQSRSIPAQRK